MSDYVTGKCAWCGDEGDVFKDNLRCDDCDSDVRRCSICKQDYHANSTCRHIFQDKYFEWRGGGIRPNDTEMRLPVHRFLSAMGEDFARDLKIAIASGKFHTWFVAPMIGGGGLISLYGMPDRDGRSMVNAWSDKLIELGEGPNAEKLQDGYRWLSSLYNRNTSEANLTTIEWIDRWLWPLTPVRRAA